MESFHIPSGGWLQMPHWSLNEVPLKDSGIRGTNLNNAIKALAKKAEQGSFGSCSGRRTNCEGSRDPVDSCRGQ